MRKFLLSALILTTGVSARGLAQTSKPATSDWTHVQVLKMGTNIHIKTLDHGNFRCAVGATSEDSVTCGGVVFQRSKILYVKSSHKLRSTLVGVAAGYGGAAVLTIVYAESCNSNCKIGSAVAVALIDLGLLVATPIVFGVYDLTAGTIYKAATP